MTPVSIPRRSRGLYDCLAAIGQNQNRTVIAQSMVTIFVAVIPAEADILNGYLILHGAI